ncbi:uncharacterized [Tachysurus ichikawai]
MFVAKEALCIVVEVDRAADSCSQQAHSRLSHSRIMKPLWLRPNSLPFAAVQKNTAHCLGPCPAAVFSEECWKAYVDFHLNLWNAAQSAEDSAHQH